MIPVKKNYKKIPEKLTGDKFLWKIKQLLEEKEEHKVSSDYYRHESVVKALETLYHKKCAYCEANPSVTSSIRIDHHRPKKGIKGETHSGYYWLAYEWSNLIPTCEKCNGAKSNIFPIETTGKRVEEPVLYKNKKIVLKDYRWTGSHVYKAEKALLLHPEVDDPTKHLRFLPTGIMEGITPRGEKSIDVYNLNREDLVLARKKLVDDIMRELRTMMAFAVLGESNAVAILFKALFDKLYQSMKPEQPFSRFGWFMFFQFELVFIDGFDKKAQRFLKKAYSYYMDPTE